jgi:O-acetylhomoserine (thiol)-lyase
MGAALSAQAAWNLLQGLETLALRIERICANTQTIAEYLEGHEAVSWVKYAGLSHHKDHELAKRYMNGQASGILSFGIKGGRDAGVRFYDALGLILRLVNIGDAKTCSAIPAVTTHRQLNDEELAAAGVTPDMVRLSVGIEHVDDLMADLDQALKASQG